MAQQTYGNKDDFKNFLKILTRFDNQHKPKKLICFSPIKENKAGAAQYFFEDTDNLDEVFDHLAEFNEKQYNCSFALHELGKDGDTSGGRKHINCSRIRCLAVDIDYYIPLDVLQELIDLSSPTLVVISSKNPDGTKTCRAHFYWSVASTDKDFSELIKDEYEKVQLALAAKFAEIIREKLPDIPEDNKITDRGLIRGQITLRLPGCIIRNTKSSW